MTRIVFRTIATIQAVLGLAYLVFPDALLRSMGHHVPPTDLHYPLAMLGARFIAYGLGFWLLSEAPEQHVTWIRLMALIQAIDLSAGIFYTASGVVPITLSGFPMFNALWIGLVCLLWRPSTPQHATAINNA